MRGEGEVPDDLLGVVIDEDVSAGSLCGDMAGVQTQPRIEFGMSAIEVVQVVMVSDWFRFECQRIRARRRGNRFSRWCPLYAGAAEPQARPVRLGA